MSSFIIRRLFQTLIVLIAMTFATYVMMGLMPGDPLDIACNANPYCSPENVEQMKKNLGLDKPLPERYFIWLRAFVQGDMGYSRTYRRPVAEILLPRLGNSIILGLGACLLSLLIALPLGVLSGSKARSWLDYAVNFFCFLGISTPSFWLALMFIYLFSVNLGWFPAGGTQSIDMAFDASNWEIFVDRLRHLVLPVCALSLLTVASWLRQTRSAVLQELSQDYVRTARAKGLTWKRSIWVHAVRNALLPVVTVVALGFSIVFSGAVITETVFTYNGLGKLMYDSILGNDFNVAMCAFVISCVAVLLSNLAADILYAVLDPRIKVR
jgi:peptide/nickel transport system permease protein